MVVNVKKVFLNSVKTYTYENVTFNIVNIFEKNVNINIYYVVIVIMCY